MEACAIIPPSREPFDSEQQKILECLDLIDCLSGLVRIEPPLSEDEETSLQLRTHFVTMAHFSVNEYLQQLNTSTRFGVASSWFEKGHASSYLSQACFIYLLDVTGEAQLTTSKTMLEYANQFWPVHLASYIQAKDDTQYAGEATSAALAAKIRNLIEFPDLDMYDDSSSLRQHVQDIVQSYLGPKRYNKLFGKILRSTAYRKDVGCSRDNSPKPTFEGLRYPVSLYPSLEPGHLRLLILHPAEEHEDLVRCSLVMDNLRNRAEYSFLSYYWGQYDSAGLSLISVDGKPVWISPNLFGALHKLRTSSKPVAFWVDVMCIQHGNGLETHNQIARMADYVRYASSTQAWIPDECTDDAPQRTFLRNLYSQRYWHRRWIQQELILARDVRIQWARVKISWADLMHIVQEKVLEVCQEPPDEGTISAINYFSDLHELRESLRLNKPMFKAEAVLYMLRNTVTAYEMDLVPSILPLLSIDERSRLEVDENPLNFVHIMACFAKVSMERSRGYQILSMIDRTNYELSWVPRWRDIEDYPLVPGDSIPKQSKLYEASAAIPTFIVERYTLCIDGWLLGKISSAEKIAEIMQNGQSAEIGREKLVRVVLEDRCRESPLSAFQRMDTQSLNWFIELPDELRLSFELGYRGSRASRCIAETDAGLLANVSAHTRVGDVIAIFHGGEVPYVLRPVSDGEYILIGEW